MISVLYPIHPDVKKSELHDECCAGTRLALNMDVRFMQHHDLFAQAEANAAAILFRSEKWNEYFFKKFA